MAYHFLATDDLTVLLGFISVTVFLLRNLYKPQPLVHPILLGRQSDVARVRIHGESAVYRNYGTGMIGRFPSRPEKDIILLSDFVRTNQDTPRTLWSTKITNAQLKSRIDALATGLVRIAALVPRQSTVLLLLNDSIEFLIADLALSSRGIPSHTLTSPALLSPVLDAHPPTAIITHAAFLPHVLELILDNTVTHAHTVIVVGEPEAKHIGNEGVRVIRWADVEVANADTVPVVDSGPNHFFTTSFFTGENGQLQGAQLTHENLTAGVSAIRALPPISSAITSLDTLASAHTLSTAFGRAVAYTAVYEGTSFVTMDSTRMFVPEQDKKETEKDIPDILSAYAHPIPPPTLLFLTPAHLEALGSELFRTAQSSSPIVYAFAWRHKVAALVEGYMTRESLWDRLVFDGARAKVLGGVFAGGAGEAEGRARAGALRGVVAVGGPMEATALTPLRVVLSVPFVYGYAHPLLAGPVFASHPLDLQTFPGEGLAAVGPPSVNVEVKLEGVDDDKVEGGADPVGGVLVKGPSVGQVLGADVGEDGWVRVGERARVLPNGTFKVLFE